MRCLLVTSSLGIISMSSAAFAGGVYPGCAVYNSPKPGHHTFYVDPQSGSMSGDGSAAKPWRTLAEVLANRKLISTQSHWARGGTDPLSDANVNGPIKAGDVIMLKSGNHGDVYLFNYFNKDFITVMAAPNETPTLSSLKVTSSAKWKFQGLKVMAGDTKPGYIVKLSYGDYQGTTNNIIFDGGTVSSTDDTTGWSDADWAKRVQSVGIFTANAPCAAITNNHIYNVMNGITLDSPQSLVEGNKIDKMMNDGIDFTASKILIKNNVVQDGAENDSFALHADGMQGWSKVYKGVVQPVTDVVIDGNIVLKLGDPNKSYMQGINIFDGLLDKITIINNVVAVNARHAMTLGGPQNSTIVNNTVLATNPAKNMSWINLARGKNGIFPSNTVVRNNIASQIILSGNGMTIDHNMVISGLQLPGASRPVSSGTVGNRNVVNPNVQGVFNSFNPGVEPIDLGLKRGSPAIGAGQAIGAPQVDLLGRRRSAPVDLGAYNH